MKILALGDSYTIGEGVAEDDRWPVQLVRVLQRAGASIDELTIIARTGWTTDELDAALTERAPAGRYDLVTLLAGVNNQYRGRSSEEFGMEFRGLLGRAAAFATSAERVIAVSIPDWGVTPFNTQRDAAAVAREIDAFNAIARAEAARASAAWVDITDLTRAHPEEIVADGLHPSAVMYTRWVDRIAPVARDILRTH